MNTTPPDDPQLRGLLREWKPDVALPPRFQEAVGRRIERAEVAAAVPASTGWERLMQSLLQPKWAKMCARIAEGNRELASVLAASTNVTLAVQEKLADVATLRAECQTQMLRHFYEVSGSMPPDQGRRYLQAMTKKTCLPDYGMAQTP